MIVSAQQKQKALEIASRGRGGLLLDGSQRQTIVDSTVHHFEQMCNTGDHTPDRDEIIRRVKKDSSVKTIIPFLILAVIGAIISWIVTYLMDQWFKHQVAEIRKAKK